MNDSADSNDILRGLCTGQLLAVLATDAGSGPYASLVAVTVTPDLHQLFFATLRATRKWANLAERCPSAGRNLVIRRRKGRSKGILVCG